MGCATTITMQSSLNDQVMLMAANKNFKAEYTLSSDVPNGNITTISVQKNGTERSSAMLDYASETAFNNIWASYFDNKFNAFSQSSMQISVTLKELYLKETSATSIGSTFLTGNTKSNVEAVSRVYVEIEHNGEVFSNEFEVSSTDYQETQSTSFGTVSSSNPMQQKSALLQASLNRAVIQFDNFVSSVLRADD